MTVVTKISTLRIGQPITGLAGYVSPTLVLILLVLPFPLLRCHQLLVPSLFSFVTVNYCHSAESTLAPSPFGLAVNATRVSFFFFCFAHSFRVVTNCFEVVEEKKTMTGEGGARNHTAGTGFVALSSGWNSVLLSRLRAMQSVLDGSECKS